MKKNKISQMKPNVSGILKTIYISDWDSEFSVGYDWLGYYLQPTLNTNWDKINEQNGFKEEHYGHYVCRLASPENYHLTWDDVVDVTEINGVLAVICEQDGKLSVHPAFGGSGFAMDSYCHDLGTYGDWGDYTKIDCPSCNHSWYFNQRRIPDSEMYECICPKCGMLLKRKNV